MSHIHTHTSKWCVLQLCRVYPSLNLRKSGRGGDTLQRYRFFSLSKYLKKTVPFASQCVNTKGGGPLLKKSKLFNPCQAIRHHDSKKKWRFAQKKTVATQPRQTAHYSNNLNKLFPHFIGDSACDAGVSILSTSSSFLFSCLFAPAGCTARCFFALFNFFSLLVASSAALLRLGRSRINDLERSTGHFGAFCTFNFSLSLLSLRQIPSVHTDL